MPMQDPEGAIAHLTGMVSGLLSAVQALAMTHPEPRQALVHLESAAQQQLAMLEPIAVPEETVQSNQYAVEVIRRALERNLKLKTILRS